MRNKDKKGQRPNAPDLQQILLEPPHSQPPINPYYYEDNLRGPPPAYSDLTIQAAAVEPSRPRAMNRTEYSRFQTVPSRGPTQVVVQQPVVQYRRNDVYHQRVKGYNTNRFISAIIIALTSLYAHRRFFDRNCIGNFVVHKPSPSVEIKIDDVRDMHVTVAFACALIAILSLIKCCTGSSKSYSCYLFLMGLINFIMTLFVGYLAYLAFYTTCSVRIGELVSGAAKTIASRIFEGELPAPDRGVFGESNVFQFFKEDRAGVVIFLIDALNFVQFLIGFIRAVTLC